MSENETNQEASQAPVQSVVTTHNLKTLPEYFRAVANLKKPFEIRKNDRDFKVGDVLRLQEWSPNDGYTGEYVAAEITYMTSFEQRADYVVMGIDVVSGPQYPLCITYSTIKGASIATATPDEVSLYFDSPDSANELCEQIRRRRFAESL